MARPPVNIAASVKARLLHLAREERQPFDVLLVRFALERLLYRLSISPLRDQFILKGGLFLALWLEDSNRVTRDADFLAFGDASAERLIADFGAIMGTEAEDGLVFDTKALTARPIREEAEYGGMRLSTTAYLERTRIPITIDLGFGDAVAEPTAASIFPTLLDFPDPEIRVYPPATVIAEKFQAMVMLGIANGRMKDFFTTFGPFPRHARSIRMRSTQRSRRPSIAGARRFRPNDRPDYRRQWPRIAPSNASGAPMGQASISKESDSGPFSTLCGTSSAQAANDFLTGVSDKAFECQFGTWI